MKVALCSDIHLEFGTISLENTENADVLILSGDICVAKDFNKPDMYGINDSDKMIRIYNFFKECSERFPHVIYIAGNHEHYHGDFRFTHGTLRHGLADFANVHFLEKEFLEIGDTMFFGATLWTDMNKEDPNTLYGIKGYMNDYRIITDADNPVTFKDADGKFHTRTGKFSPEESVLEHKATLKLLDEAIGSRSTAKWVVVGHHAPSKLSTKPQYENDVMVNGAYSSDLSEFILNHPQIKLWTHGHTHHNFDYMIGSTRIVANPRGYINYEDQADNFELQFIEV
jgi:predicted phosphodiesterase